MAVQAVEAKDGFNPLVLIQEARGVPFFCVHGAGGNVLNLRDIAGRLGSEQSFYGLQARGVDGSKPLASIEAMAALYLPEILRVHPHGPFLLGGYSGGGNVAFEMAQQLQKRGLPVALVVLLDTYRAGIKPVRKTLREHLAILTREGPAYLEERTRERLARFKKEMTEELKTRFYTMQAQPLPYELRDLEMTRAFWAAADAYQPAPYDGRAVLYRASLIAPIFAHAGPALGWSGLIQDLEIVEVPGDHDSLVYEPNVSVMANHLRHALAAAAGRA